MLEITQEILEKIDPLLDEGDAESAARLLIVLEDISRRALLLHILRDRGLVVAEAVAEAYLSATADPEQEKEAA